MTDPDRPRLFDGPDALFLTLLSRSRRYGEYGMGLSTLAAADTPERLIRSVDTSDQWKIHVTNQLSDRQQAQTTLIHVDLGPVRNWGFPASYECRARFRDYFDAPWEEGFDPDLVLIDGRFRVACFLTSLLRAKAGTLILFDDYADREYYHIVETCLAPEQRSERQAVFRVPQTGVDRDRVAALLERFTYVMD